MFFLFYSVVKLFKYFCTIIDLVYESEEDNYLAQAMYMFDNR